MYNTAKARLFPALRSRIGDWYYYVTTLSFSEVAQRIQPATELVTTSDMSSWIQRSIVNERAKKIANYLITRTQHFFPGIVVVFIWANRLGMKSASKIALCVLL